MNKRLLALMLVLTMAISLLAGCTQPAPATPPAEQPAEQPAEPAKEAVFNWNIGADPKTIDPVLNGASDGGDVINQTFEEIGRASCRARVYI